jgi:ribosomal protein S18 acetylase RimI-like enzyme
MPGGAAAQDAGSKSVCNMVEAGERLYRLTRGDTRRAGAVLKEAFQEDPLWNRFFAGEPEPEGKLQAFFEVPVLYGLRYGEAVAPSAALEGVAAWFPGDRAKMSFWRLLASGALRPGWKLGMKLVMKLERIFSEVARDHRENMNGRPYLYLQVMGVAQEYRGRGLGGRMLGAFIEAGERESCALYLETETEQNVGLYERFGFRTLKRIILPVVGLPMWEMARFPQG